MTHSLRTLTFAAVFALAVTPLAQAQDSASTIGSLSTLYNNTVQNITKTADMVDDDMLAYRPSVNVRTVQQQLGHIINAQFGLCSLAAGEDSPAEGNYEETATTKEALVAAINASTAYCRGVYDAMTDETATAKRTLFGQEMTASAVLAFNMAHNYEHYGNLVTYMRINGIVPPSSQQ
ncbi:MAG: hypothetical protein RhofKO_36240 [Rhodothermales bacterium]